MTSRNHGKAITYLFGLLAAGAAILVGVSYYFSTSSIHQLLSDNRDLKVAIENLTSEAQIGYATLQSQSRNEQGQLISKVRFVQTASDNPKTIVSEEVFSIEGDIVHFDALIVKFTQDYVQSGEGKALYLWRRIYGENTPPSQGAQIEIPGTAPDRYYNITKALKMKDQAIFWEAIWELANDPDALSQHGIQAVFGNAIYTRLTEDRIYYFKLNRSGQIYIDVFDVR